VGVADLVRAAGLVVIVVITVESGVSAVQRVIRRKQKGWAKNLYRTRTVFCRAQKSAVYPAFRVRVGRIGLAGEWPVRVGRTGVSGHLAKSEDFGRAIVDRGLGWAHKNRPSSMRPKVYQKIY
jgi:hypothetical protein